MSGAAAIAAAKNRRGRLEANQKQLPPPISCGKNNSCPPQQNKNNVAVNKSVQGKAVVQPSSNDLIDPSTLQILGPLPPAQILRLHEQRLNKIDEKFNTLCAPNACDSNANVCATSATPTIIDDELGEELFGRIGNLESKLTMLEEVIMTLQNKLTISQNFAMETSMSVTTLAKEQQKILQQVLEQVLEQVQAQVQAQVLEQVQAHLEAHAQLTTTTHIDITNDITEPASPEPASPVPETASLVPETAQTETAQTETASPSEQNENNISIEIIEVIN